MNRIHKLAYSIFKKYIPDKKEAYAPLRLALKQARLGLPWGLYVSTAYFLSVLTALVGFVSGLLLLPLWRYIYKTYLTIAPHTGIKVISVYGEWIFVIFLLLIFSLSLGLFTYYVIISYPHLTAHFRKSKIDMTLPHTVAYMHALSKGGINLISIFKSLSEHINIYGESAEEISYILIDTELHGSDMNTALKNAALTTQSEKFRDFLDNLLNIIETGGDMETFFASMVDHYQMSAEADQSMYLEMLGMLAETYITVFVAGPLFLITILIVMGIMGPGSLLTLKVIIYILIPLSAVAFSILLSIVSIGSDSRLIKIYSVSKKITHYDDVRVIPPVESDKKIIRKLMRSLRWTGIMETRNDPFRPFFVNPIRVFYITIPAALIYFIISVYNHKITLSYVDDHIIISTLILFVPFLFFYEMQMKRIRQIGDSVPAFLRRLATISDMGTPLSDAIKSISRINLGVLSTEVKLIHKDILWSRSIMESLTKFEHRVNTISISRVVTLITKASEASANIKETLRVAARDADLSEKLTRQKFTVLFSYLIVIYMSFAVFMLVLYVFATMFLPHIPETSGGRGMFMISAHTEEYTMLFMHASVIQGFFSGIIAGQMMGENIFDGLKHSMIMMTVAYIFFVFFV
ncbi:MAG: type II secretion system F family protein [Candidatus Methanoperedens sp.]|nr:type II secretion system F family protein [Candidatus Methanoperedens sp.]